MTSSLEQEVSSLVVIKENTRDEGTKQIVKISKCQASKINMR